jgi:translation initiation factor 1A
MGYYRRKPRAPEAPHELRLPQGGQVLGKVAKISGASKFVVQCSDGNERVCSIPGRLRRRFWIREGDVVLVMPWTVQSNERGDIVWRYSIMDTNRIRERKLI